MQFESVRKGLYEEVTNLPSFQHEQNLPKHVVTAGSDSL